MNPAPDSDEPKGTQDHPQEEPEPVMSFLEAEALPQGASFISKETGYRYVRNELGFLWSPELREGHLPEVVEVDFRRKVRK